MPTLRVVRLRFRVLTGTVYVCMYFGRLDTDNGLLGHSYRAMDMNIRFNRRFIFCCCDLNPLHLEMNMRGSRTILNLLMEPE